MSRLSTALAASTLALCLVPVAIVSTADATSAADPGDAPVVHDLDGAQVVVERSPFRLTVNDADGSTVLREVEHAATDSIAEPLTIDPMGSGSDNQDTTSLYSPLSFMVGTETLTQYTGSEWVSNLKHGAPPGHLVLRSGRRERRPRR